jgi:hypothetical protein
MILAEKRNVDEDNFDEAVGMIWNACHPTKVRLSPRLLIIQVIIVKLIVQNRPNWINHNVSTGARTRRRIIQKSALR